MRGGLAQGLANPRHGTSSQAKPAAQANGAGNLISLRKLKQTMPSTDNPQAIAKQLLLGKPYTFCWRTIRSLERQNPLLMPVARFSIRLRLKNEMLWHEHSGAMLRGVFGTALHAVDAHQAYPVVFGDVQFDDRPRPFRLWACSGVHTPLPRGAVTEFGFDLYGDQAVQQIPAVVRAWQTAADLGLGEGRSKAVLESIAPIRPPKVLATSLARLADWLAEPVPIRSVRFLSPTAFKHNGRVRSPSVELMVASAVRRLSAFCGIPFLPPDVQVGWAHESLRRVWIGRKSMRAGETRLTGWVGEARPEAPLGPDAALALRVGQVIGVGRHAPFGFGEFRLE